MDNTDFGEDLEDYGSSGGGRRRRKILFWILFGVIVVGIILAVLSFTTCRGGRNVDIEVVYDNNGVDAIVNAYYMDSNRVLQHVGKELSFSHDDTDSNKVNQSVIMPPIKLDKTNDFAVFAYHFENATLEDQQIEIDISNSSMTVQNVAVTYCASYVGQIELSDDGHFAISDAQYSSVVLNPYMDAWIYVKAQLVNAAQDAVYSGDLYWILSPLD